MAREIGIGDVVALTATVGKRIEEYATLRIPGYHYPYAIRDPKAKPGDRIRYEAEVTGVDEEDGRLTLRGGINLTVDAGAVELMRKWRRPRGTEPLRRK